MRGIVAELKTKAIRVSMFVDATERAVQWAHAMGADRIELYTGPFAQAFARDRGSSETSFAQHRAAALRAHALGLGINAGHDLDLDNLVVYRQLPHLAEVSIGHALISRALFVGLDQVVREYLDVLHGRAEEQR
jgi:pyridoxine 5-phosphate synthase